MELVVGNFTALDIASRCGCGMDCVCDYRSELRGDEVKRAIALTGDNQKLYALNCMKLAMAEGIPHRVKIEPITKDRKSSQNRLQHHWNGEIHTQSKQLGEYPVETLGELRAYNKLRFGVPILLEDEHFEKVWRMATGHLNYGAIMEFIEVTDFPVTRLMSVKQMTMFLTDMKTFWNIKGALLSTSEDFYFEAMGLKR